MDPNVKKEVEEEHLRTASHQEDDFILAKLSHTPKPKPSSSGKKNLPMEKTERPLKIKKCFSETIIKHAASDHGGNFVSCKKNKSAIDGQCTPGEAKSPAMIRAEEVQSNLEPAFPSFAKSMVRSHVASCFWMGLPGQFCKSHLPNEDTMIILEDECGKGYEIKYIAYKTGLSAGWRQFSVGHNLLEGDVLVFQLVEPIKFKVYIIRANDFTEVDGALGLLNLDAHTNQNSYEIGKLACTRTKRKRPKSLSLTVVQKKKKKSSRPRLALNLRQPAEQSENDSEEVGSEVLEGFKLSGPTTQFKDIRSFEDFNISVDGLVLDSELSEDIRGKYYKLCCSQNAFLHENIIQGINYKLIVGTISETVNIADAMRACKLTTSRDEFATWDKTLIAFELLGMSVGFLRARLCRLVSLAFETEAATDTRRYIKAKTRRAQIEDEMRKLEARLLELKNACDEMYGAEIESLKSKAESYELKFQEEATAPW